MKYLWPLFATLCLSACHPHSAPRRGGSPFDTAGPAGARESNPNYGTDPLVCAGTDCPRGLGVITTKTKTGVLSCAGFMANDRTFVTNRGCLPPELKTAGVTCRGKLAIQIADGTRTITVDCGRVIDVSREESGFQADYAFIQTAAPVGPRLIIDRRGVTDGQELMAWTVSNEDHRHVVRAKSCRVALNTWLNPFATSSFTAVSLATDCDLNAPAGVPLVTREGEVVGLGQTRATQADLPSLAALVPGLAPALPSAIPPHVRFTNLACINDPVTGAGPQVNCAAVTRSSDPACVVQPIVANANLDYRTTEIERDLPRLFRYRLTFNETRRTLVVLPTCVVTNRQDVNAWALGTRVRMSYGVMPYHALTAAFAGIVEMKVRMGLNPAGLLKPTVEFKRGSVARHEFELAHRTFAHEWTGTISRPRTGGGTLTLPITIEECTSEQYELGNQRRFQSRDGRDLDAEGWIKYLEDPRGRAFCAPYADR